MAKRIEFTKEQKQEIRIKFCKARKLKDVKSYNHVSVLNMRRLGKTNKEISTITGYNAQYITDLVRLYVEKGMSAMVGNHCTSHNRRMSFEAETHFLEQFHDGAASGTITTVQIILDKYEEITAKKSNPATIYKLLKRHGWRKIQPRPHHPNGASEEEKKSSKKLTHFGKKSYWKNM